MELYALTEMVLLLYTIPVVEYKSGIMDNGVISVMIQTLVPMKLVSSVISWDILVILVIHQLNMIG